MEAVLEAVPKAASSKTRQECLPLSFLLNIVLITLAYQLPKWERASRDIIRKEELKLFSDDVIVPAKSPKRNITKTIKLFSKLVEYKTDLSK